MAEKLRPTDTEANPAQGIYSHDENFGYDEVDRPLPQPLLLEETLFSAESIVTKAQALGLIPESKKNGFLNNLKNLFGSVMDTDEGGSVDTKPERKALFTAQLQIFVDYFQRFDSVKGPKPWLELTAAQVRGFSDFIALNGAYATEFNDNPFSRMPQTFDWAALLSEQVILPWFEGQITQDKKAEMPNPVLSLLNRFMVCSHPFDAMDRKIIEALRPEVEKILITLIKDYPEHISAGFMKQVLLFSDDPSHIALRTYLFGEASGRKKPGSGLEKILHHTFNKEGFTPLLVAAVERGHPAALERLEEILLKDKRGYFTHHLVGMGGRAPLIELQKCVWGLVLEDALPKHLQSHLQDGYRSFQEAMRVKLPQAYRNTNTQAARLLVFLAGGLDEGISHLARLEEMAKGLIPPKQYRPLDFKSLDATLIHRPQDLLASDALNVLEKACKPSPDEIPWNPVDAAERLIHLAGVENKATLRALDALTGMIEERLMDSIRDHPDEARWDPSRSQMGPVALRLLKFFDSELNVDFLFAKFGDMAQKDDAGLLSPTDAGDADRSYNVPLHGLFTAMTHEGFILPFPEFDPRPHLPKKAYQLIRRLLLEESEETVLVDRFKELEEHGYYQDQDPDPWQSLVGAVIRPAQTSPHAWSTVKEIVEEASSSPPVAEGLTGEDAEDPQALGSGAGVAGERDPGAKKEVYFLGVEKIATTENEYLFEAVRFLLDIEDQTKDEFLLKRLATLDTTAVEAHYEPAEMPQDEIEFMLNPDQVFPAGGLVTNVDPDLYAKYFEIMNTWHKTSPLKREKITARPEGDAPEAVAMEHGAQMAADLSFPDNVLSLLTELARYDNAKAVGFLLTQFKAGHFDVFEPLKNILSFASCPKAHKSIVEEARLISLKEPGPQARKFAYELVKEAASREIVGSWDAVLENVEAHYQADIWTGYATQAARDILTSSSESLEHAEALHGMDAFLASQVGMPSTPEDALDPYLLDYAGLPGADQLADFLTALEDYDAALEVLAEIPPQAADEELEEMDAEGVAPDEAFEPETDGDGKKNKKAATDFNAAPVNHKEGPSSSASTFQGGSPSSALDAPDESAKDLKSVWGDSAAGPSPFLVANPQAAAMQLFQVATDDSFSEADRKLALDELKNLALQFPQLKSSIGADFKELLLMPEMPEPLFELSLDHLLALASPQSASVQELIREASDLAKSGNDFGSKILQAIIEAGKSPFDQRAQAALTSLNN